MEGLEQLRTEWAELSQLEQILWAIVGGQILGILATQSRLHRELGQLWRTR